MEHNKTISVCLLVTDFDALTGGVQRNSRLLLSEFNKRQMKTFVCARNYYDLPPNEEKDGTLIHRSPVTGKSRAINGIIYLVDTFIWLIRNQKNYDVIHCQQMFGPTMAGVFSGLFTGKPVVTRITLSGETGEAAAVRKMPLSSLRVRLIQCVAVWIVLTHEMKSELQTLGIPQEKIRVIYNSTALPETTAFDDQAKFLMRRQLELLYKKLAVFVGRLSEEKRLDVLIEAWQAVVKEHPEAHLLLLGEGGEYRNVDMALRTKVVDLGLNNEVHFLGHVPNSKEFILASDAFILPSNAEGMSNALVEAFACGAAIVATNIPANAEICESGINSILVPVDDEEFLSQAILSIFDSPELGRRLGEAAREKAERELSVDRMVDFYLQAYSSVLA